MSKMRNLNPHNCGSSRNLIRILIISGRYDNPLGYLRIYKKFSTVMISYKDLLIVMSILEGPRYNIKIVVCNNK